MWNHPITNQHLKIISDWGIHIIQPIIKQLACGDIGIGAMENPKEIITQLKLIIESRALKISQD